VFYRLAGAPLQGAGGMVFPSSGLGPRNAFFWVWGRAPLCLVVCYLWKITFVWNGSGDGEQKIKGFLWMFLLLFTLVFSLYLS